MVRLTADLIWKSPHFFNAIKERELDLRGIPISFLLSVYVSLSLTFFYKWIASVSSMSKSFPYFWQATR